MTTRRTLTTTLTSDCRAAWRRSDQAAQAGRYQGETLDFEGPGAIFVRLARVSRAVPSLRGIDSVAICTADLGRPIATRKRLGRHNLLMVKAASADRPPWLSAHPRAGLPLLGRRGARRWA